MTLYLDASALVAIVADEPLSQTVFDAIRSQDQSPLISDFCRAEASSALAKRMRMGALPAERIELYYAYLDQWALVAGERVTIFSEDIERSAGNVRREDLSLRAPDAIHIAAAHRLSATLLTLDRGMARAAAALGVPYLNPAEGPAPGEPKD